MVGNTIGMSISKIGRPYVNFLILGESFLNFTTAFGYLLLEYVTEFLHINNLAQYNLVF